MGIIIPTFRVELWPRLKGLASHTASKGERGQVLALLGGWHPRCAEGIKERGKPCGPSSSRAASLPPGVPLHFHLLSSAFQSSRILEVSRIIPVQSYLLIYLKKFIVNDSLNWKPTVLQKKAHQKSQAYLDEKLREASCWKNDSKFLLCWHKSAVPPSNTTTAGQATNFYTYYECNHIRHRQSLDILKNGNNCFG